MNIENLIKTETIRKKLIEENLYTEKDEITLFLYENTLNQYITACENVKENGNTIVKIDYNGNPQQVTNPAFRNMMELQKELFKILNSLYLNPRSRSSAKDAPDPEDDFSKMEKALQKHSKKINKR